jgi:sialic acid synthase SpsE
MEPSELKQMILDINDANAAIGDPNVWRTDAEEESVRLRPSLRFERDLPAGTILDPTNFRSVRPAGGLSPKELKNILGKETNQPVSHGQAVTWNLLD